VDDAEVVITVSAPFWTMLRGPGAYRYWTNPCSSDFRELVFGLVDESPNHIRLLRNRWHDGGENAVHQHYWEAGRRAWAWWRFSCPLRERRMALKFRTEAEAIIALGFADEEERAQIAAEGIIEQQLAEARRAEER
jgi:hypothetical protein